MLPCHAASARFLSSLPRVPLFKFHTAPRSLSRGTTLVFHPSPKGKVAPSERKRTRRRVGLVSNPHPAGASRRPPSPSGRDVETGDAGSTIIRPAKASFRGSWRRVRLQPTFLKIIFCRNRVDTQSGICTYDSPCSLRASSGGVRLMEQDGGARAQVSHTWTREAFGTPPGRHYERPARSLADGRSQMT